MTILPPSSAPPAWSAELFVFQMQDVLGGGAEARINTPGTVGGNWCWRMKPGLLTPQLEKKACGAMVSTEGAVNHEQRNAAYWRAFPTHEAFGALCTMLRNGNKL